MKSSKIKEPHEIYLFIGAIFLGVLIHTLIYLHFKSEIISSNTSIDLYFSAKPSFETDLFYSFGKGFDPDQRIDGEILNHDNIVRFNLPRSNDLVTNFRLDFNNVYNTSFLIIDSLAIHYGTREKVLSRKEVFKNIFLNSAAVQLDLNNNIIEFNKNVNPYDPYIIFDPLLQIIFDDFSLKWASLFLPFAIVLLILLIKSSNERNMTMADYLFLAFIISIPLKIAWTTFVAILICLWGLYKSWDRLDFKNPNGLFLSFLFFVIVIFGRPLELKVIDHQLALLVFCLIICSNILHKKRVANCYIYVFLFLNALIFTSALGFLISFPEVFGMDFIEYFKGIKTYSGNTRNWLYYDHAAFLSLFAIMIIPLMDEMTEFNRKTRIFWIYNILLVLTIILMGVRISFLVYLMVLLNVFLKLEYKWRIGLNTFLFIITATFIFVNIDSLDPSRHELWKVSWEGIKESPFFGHGLGSSDRILHNSEMIGKTGIEIPRILNHSHNQFLTLWLELGLAGIVSILILLSIYLMRTKQYKSKPMVLFIFALSYIFLTESVLQTSKPFFVLCFLFALMSLGQNYKDGDKQHSNEI